MHDDQTYPKTTWTTTNQHLNGNRISQNVLNILITQNMAERLDKTIYSSSLSPEEILDEGRLGKVEKQMGVTTTFSRSKNIDSMRHIFTGRQWSTGQDGEQDTNDDEDNACNAERGIPQAFKSQTPSDSASSRAAARPPSPRRSFQRRFDAQYDEPRIFPISTSTLKKRTKIAVQLALTRAEFEGIDSDSSSLLVIEGFRPGQYIRIQSTNVPCEN